MACDTWRSSPKQTPQERTDEVRRAVEKFAKALANGTAKVTVGPQGAVTVEGMSTEDRAGVTDACAIRKIMATGSSLAKAKIAAAEARAGRGVNKQAQVHSHDGGKTWHPNH
jgi:hypothetical protein